MKIKFAFAILTASATGNTCNQDCLDYCLTYFPVSNSAEKCGCSFDE